MNIVECMFTDLLACIRKLVENDKAKFKLCGMLVMQYDGNVECWFVGCWGCWMLVICYVGNVGYPGCKMLGMWDVGDGTVADVRFF